MTNAERVLVYGASGHTGRFMADELAQRGLTPVLAGRNAERLSRAAGRHGWEQRVVGLDDAEALRRALGGVAAVVNCAGPFLDTALPLARAAVAAGVHYLDVTAEQQVVESLYQQLDVAAREAGVAVVPAMAFYGGLADLLVTAALEGELDADEVDVAIALDHWWPTEGTRLTGARNTAPRRVLHAGRLAALPVPAPTRSWDYSVPFGELEVVQMPFSEVPTIHDHLAVGTLRSWLNTGSLAELRDPATAAPAADDEHGRSAQRFAVDVVVRRDGRERRLTATGRDIYAVTAPLVVEGVLRLLDGRSKARGASAPGRVFDAPDLLASLARHPRGITLGRDPRPRQSQRSASFMPSWLAS